MQPSDTDAEGDSPTIQERPAASVSEEDVLEEFPEDPGPAPELTGTLCNLTRDHLGLLNEHVSNSDGLDEQNLRLALISLGDRLETWEGISWHFPESQDDIETAQSIYSHWEYALALLDSGDEGPALKELDVASALIKTLPGDAVDQLGCER